MRITLFYPTPTDPDGLSTMIDVSTDMAVDDFKATVEAFTGIPTSQQYLMCRNQPLSSLSPPKLDGEFKDAQGASQGRLEEDDIIYVSTQAAVPRRRPGHSSQQQQQQGQQQTQGQQRAAAGGGRSGGGNAAEAERMRLAALGDANFRERIRTNYPELADAVNDAVLFARRYEETMRKQEQAAREKEEALARLNDDPFDVESQAKIEEIIRMENVRNNMDIAIENIPESFTKTTMLYVPVIVNGYHIKAFVDSGAQATIMSGACAQRCGLMRLLDKNYAGMARGVGTAPILGRVHVAILSIGGVALHCSFTVMDGKDVDLLLGLDMLKRHRASINLKRNVLEISDVEVSFLPDSETPGFEAEPVIQGPGGLQIGGRTGAVVDPQGGQGGQGSLSIGGGGGAGAGGGAGGLSSGGAAAQAARQHWGGGGGGQQQQQTPAAATTTPATTATTTTSSSNPGFSTTTAAPPPRAEFPRSSIDAVMSLTGCSEVEAVQVLQLTNGNVDAAAGYFFGD